MSIEFKKCTNGYNVLLDEDSCGLIRLYIDEWCLCSDDGSVFDSKSLEMINKKLKELNNE